MDFDIREIGATLLVGAFILLVLEGVLAFVFRIDLTGFYQGEFFGFPGSSKNDTLDKNDNLAVIAAAFDLLRRARARSRHRPAAPETTTIPGEEVKQSEPGGSATSPPPSNDESLDQPAPPRNQNSDE